MKTVKFFSFGLLLIMLASCGNSGNSSDYKNNEVLGSFPDAYLKANVETSALKEEMRNKSVQSPNDYEKNRLEWEQKEAKIKQRKEETATREFEKINGKSVSFKILNEDENFTVESVKITDAAINTGALQMSVMVKAKKDLPARVQGDVYYFLVNTKDEVYLSGSFDPYAKIQVQRANRPALKAGEFTNENGSNIMLYCASYDHTDFAQIFFAKEADLNKILNSINTENRQEQKSSTENTVTEDNKSSEMTISINPKTPCSDAGSTVLTIKGGIPFESGKPFIVESKYISGGKVEATIREFTKKNSAYSVEIGFGMIISDDYEGFSKQQLVVTDSKGNKKTLNYTIEYCP